MVRQYTPQNDGRGKAFLDGLQKMQDEDPEKYAEYIEESRQRSYRLAGRNPDGSRK